ncbi:secreted protein [Melampsora americana]|nr:secreted protein [Melampsora americana]
MIYSTRPYTLILFSLLTLVPYSIGNSTPAVKYKSCNWGFRVQRYNTTACLCSDQNDTWVYLIEDCKPAIDVKRPPAASKCHSDQFPNIKNGNCPTYRAEGDRPRNKITKYACDIMISAGKTMQEDQYFRMKCQTVTNLIRCKEGRGRFVSKDQFGTAI